MIQELFRLGPIVISPFGVFMVAAFVVGYWELLRNLRRARLGDEEDASSILFAAGIGGIVGAKIYYAALYADWRLLFSRSGLVWYGGFVLGTLAVLWVARRRRLPGWGLADAAAPGLALGYGVGRIGCFLVGDDYGRPTDLAWGVAFPNGLPPTEAGYLRSEFGVALPASIPDSQLLTVHPTQLYETAAGLFIWWVGRRLLARRLPVGVAGLVVFALLAVERFAVELLRAKDDRFLGPFTLAQAIAVVILAVCLLLIRQRRSTAPAR
jgi:phosphatidylglycerol:prolipoprotein diacylglycerol transferase